MSTSIFDISSAETILIANLIIDEYNRAELLSRLQADYFENDKCRYLYHLISEMNNENILIDVYTLQEKIKNKNEYPDIGELINFLIEITSKISIVDNISTYVTLVINNATKRKLDKFLNNWVDNPDFDIFDPNTSFEKLQVTTDSIINSRNLDNISLISAYVDEFKNRIESIKHNSGKITGTTSGLQKLMKLLMVFNRET